MTFKKTGVGACGWHLISALAARIMPAADEKAHAGGAGAFRVARVPGQGEDFARPVGFGFTRGRDREFAVQDQRAHVVRVAVVADIVPGGKSRRDDFVEASLLQLRLELGRVHDRLPPPLREWHCNATAIHGATAFFESPMTETPFRQHHDMGGQPAGPVSLQEHEIEPWEKRIEAMMRCLQLRDPPILTVDQLRRCIEALPVEQYDSLTYYERWMASLAALLVEKGILSPSEIEARMAKVRALGAAPIAP